MTKKTFYDTIYARTMQKIHQKSKKELSVLLKFSSMNHFIIRNMYVSLISLESFIRKRCAFITVKVNARFDERNLFNPSYEMRKLHNCKKRKYAYVYDSNGLILNSVGNFKIVVTLQYEDELPSRRLTDTYAYNILVQVSHYAYKWVRFVSWDFP